MESSECKYKVAIIGDANVGKTSLLHYVKLGRLSEMSQPTIGCEFFSHTPNVEDGGVSREVKLLIWDTAGHQDFRTFTGNFLRGASACIICYDMTSLETFHHVEGWLKDVKTACPDGPLVALVGTKNDLVDHREVESQDSNDAGRRMNACINVETSSKTGDGVHALFRDLSQKLVTLRPRGGDAARRGHTVALRGYPHRESDCTC